MQLPLTGACQCRALRYEIDAEPLALYACHCTECQKQSASAFALSMLVPRAAVRVTQGEPREWVRRADSGRTMSCMFCAQCGTRVFHLPHSNTQVTVIKPGTLDDTSWFDPVGHIWTRSAQPWVDIPADTVNYEVQPPDQAKLIAAWKARRPA
jgi:hypothetical protein